MPGPKRSSGPRSNMYSQNRFTNWAAFDPFSAELDRYGMCGREAESVRTRTDVTIPIHEAPLKEGFVRPYSSRDVASVLSDVPEGHLKDLRAVISLGGTKKQQRARRFQYGFYNTGRIYLHPLADRWLTQRYRTPPRPSTVQEFTKFGVSSQQVRGEWVLRFSEQSLRLFYLYDVLLHELGHHVERNVRPSRSKDSERYATWFAGYQAESLKKAHERHAAELLLAPDGPLRGPQVK